MNVLLRRALLFFTLCFANATFISQSSVMAAEKQSQRLVCLQAVQCNTPGANCLENDSHRARLTMLQKSPAVPNEKTYILECVSSPKGLLCTTGNADAHTQLGWESNLAELKSNVDYSFEGIYKADGTQINQLNNPLVSNTQGTIDAVEWKSSTGNATYHTFYALNFYEPKVIQGEETSSQQQSTFELIQDTSDCVSLRWDPYGIVFDSQTLEPIPRVRISLSEKKDTGFIHANIPGVSNSITTKEDGVFNFVVPDGVYKLNATHPSYLPLPTDLTTVNNNYAKIYSDLYPVANSTNEITQVGGVTQHRDIALAPQQNTVGQYPLTVMDYYQTLEKFTNNLVIKGRVSHPFTRVKVYTFQGDSTQKARYLGTQIQADKMGLFKVQINLSTLNPGERIGGLEFEKVSFTTPLSKNSAATLFSKLFHLLFKQVEAQQINSVDLPLEPIANSLDGYAYDATGKIIPKAVVGVFVGQAKQPYYETVADENGYFKITSEFLPSMTYSLRYKNERGVIIESSVSKFLTQNSKYIESSAANPFLYKDAKGKTAIPMITPNVIKNGIIVPKQADQTTAFIVVVVLILMFGIIGTVVGVHLINKKHTTS